MRARAHALFALLLQTAAAHAEPVLSVPADAPPERDGLGERTPPLLPRHLAAAPNSFWTVGVATERFGSREVDDADAQLVGVTAMWRISGFGPHALLMTKPALGEYENSRFLLGGGLRGVVNVRGFTELSYGVGAHFEARFRDHFWLAYVTPLELGATLYQRGSWHIELFLGARRVAGGALIDQFLIDPNGVDNENAKDGLEEARHERPWKGFIRLVFARRID